MHNDAVIKECHLKMLTIELCPQGICDLAQQVVLSFSAALPSVPTTALFLQGHFHSAAWQRHSLEVSACRQPSSHRDGASRITPFTTPAREKTPMQRSPLPMHSSVNQSVLDQCGLQLNAATKHFWPGKPTLTW